jgi:sugar lactone lactonase YvrE
MSASPANAAALAQAPELPAALEWLNAPAQSLARNHGRITALLFWNASSIQCRSLINELSTLASRNGDVLRLVGLHQPRFDAELNGQTVLTAAARLGIGFAIANDPHWVCWQHYGIQAWPSIVLIDGEGRLREVFQGQTDMAEIELAVQDLRREIDIDSLPPIPSASAPRRPDQGAQLGFPSGIAVTARRFYLADAARHRIIECTHDGRVTRMIGSGQPGLADGDGDSSAFCQPHGLCVSRDLLYIADTGNHAIRTLSLDRVEVSTLLGNGKPGSPKEGAIASPGAVSLRLPQALTIQRDHLYFGDAGNHQIHELDLAHSRLRTVSGSGQFGLLDGPGGRAQFGAPAALVFAGDRMFLLDAVASALRVLLMPTGECQTLVGQGLYDFGEADGPRRLARMQNPQGLAYDPDAGLLWIADSYNSSLRCFHPASGELRTAALPFALQQPVALAWAEGSVWIADAGAPGVWRYWPAEQRGERLAIGG